MGIFIEKTAKKVEDAINDGLKELNVSRDDVDIEILSGGGLFSKAKVRLTVTAGGGASAHVGAAEEAGENAKPPQKEDKADKTDKADKAKKADKPDKPDKKEKADKPAKAVKADKPEKTDKQAKPVKAAEAAAVVTHEIRRTDGKDERKNDAPRRADADGREPFKFKKREVEERDMTPVPATEKSARAKAELEKLLSLMKVSATVTVKEYVKDIDLDIEGDVGAVIGHRGETIDAIQLILSHMVNEKPNVRGRESAGAETGESGGDGFKRIYLDAGGYRQKRKDALAELARRTAEKVLRIGKRISLEPMSSYERRVIHAVLSESDGIYTKSEGSEPRRRIVVYPKRKPAAASSAPQSAE